MKAYLYKIIILSIIFLFHSYECFSQTNSHEFISLLTSKKWILTRIRRNGDNRLYSNITLKFNADLTGLREESYPRASPLLKRATGFKWSLKDDEGEFKLTILESNISLGFSETADSLIKKNPPKFEPYFSTSLSYILTLLPIDKPKTLRITIQTIDPSKPSIHFYFDNAD